MDKKGIDMVFKGAKKKYPFLVDWFLDSDAERYVTLVPINLIINKEITCKHFGYEQRKGFLKRFTNFGWVMDCGIIKGDEIYLEIYGYFVNGYDMIPPEFCEWSEITFDGGIKRLTVSLIYSDDYVFPEPDSLRS
jgi:hypothetical protein